MRGRDGALYKNPVLIVPEGFVCFDDTEPPELVAWATAEDDYQGAPKVSDVALPLLWRILGHDGAFDAASVEFRGINQRVVPGTEPWQFLPARSFFFQLTRRIPRPQRHDGTERHATRVRGGRVLDWIAHTSDARELEIPL